MNNNTILGLAFLFAGTLFTSTMAMAPVYAEGDDDNKKYDDDNKRYDKGGDGNKQKGGDGNKQKVEDESAGAIADCDKNEVERADFDCFASAATDDSEVNTGDGRNGGNGPGNGPGNGAEDCEACIEVFLDAIADLEDITEIEELAITAAVNLFGDDCDDFSEADVEALATAILEILGTETEAELALVVNLEECLDALLEIV